MIRGSGWRVLAGKMLAAELERRRREKVLLVVDGPQWIEQAVAGSTKCRQSLKGAEVEDETVWEKAKRLFSGSLGSMTFFVLVDSDVFEWIIQ